MVTGPWVTMAHRAICLTQQVEAFQTLQSYHGLCLLFIAHQEIPDLKGQEGKEENRYSQVTRPRDCIIMAPAPSPRPTILPSSCALASPLLSACPPSKLTVMKRSLGYSTIGAIGLLKIQRKLLDANVPQITKDKPFYFLDSLLQELVF